MRGLRALLPYYRPYGRPLAAGLGLVVVSNFFALAAPQFIQRAVDALSGGAPPGAVRLYAAAIVGAALLGGLARFGMRQLLNGMSRRVETDVRAALFGRLTELEQAWYHRNPTGDLIARATNDLSAVRMAAGPALMYLTDTVTRTAIGVPLMARIDPRLTALGLAPMLLTPVVMVVLGRVIHRRFEAVQAHFATLTSHAHEAFGGVRVVRAYRQEEAQTRRFADLNAEYVRRNLALARAYGLLFPLVLLLGGIGGVLALWLGGTLVIRGTISVGELVAFLAYLAMLVWPMIAFGWVVNLLQRGSASMDRIRAVLDAHSAVADPSEPVDLPPARGSRRVEFRNVRFRYSAGAAGGAGHEAARALALEDVSFVAEPGEWVGVVGPTGAGKTTLVELLPRLMDPEGGRVLLDGVDVRHLRLSDLRRTVGFVPQETFLFSRTIRENIALGGAAPGAVADAARVARLNGTVEGFPDGYDTLLGERGVNLSGGQKQRTAIARALAGRPDVLVLDDCLSAVDAATEAEILAGLRRELAGRTALVVSHRITAIREADRIVVLDRGRVVETGRHQELFERRGLYWRLLRRQQIEEEVEAVG